MAAFRVSAMNGDGDDDGRGSLLLLMLLIGGGVGVLLLLLSPSDVCRWMNASMRESSVRNRSSRSLVTRSSSFRKSVCWRVWCDGARCRSSLWCRRWWYRRILGVSTTSSISTASESELSYPAVDDELGVKAPLRGGGGQEEEVESNRCNPEVAISFGRQTLFD